ncbi:MAG: isoprenylcysteine carboxylmethyltransferase family protein [Acidobacteria bacterium]|nr:isoprenylcysteine carboxylmethyltransferase family protein [Acidobacteriota bacterium]MCW5967147.1 isoprenylcysteine carboxylmethyltransferase family protein [Blastocatellales bacterium]
MGSNHSDKRNTIQRLRVPIGFLAAALFVALARPDRVSLSVGIPVSIFGLVIRAWASGHLRKNAELTVTGPYSYTRNPLYFGSFLMLAGAAVSGGVLWLGAGLILTFLMVYYPVVRAEEKLMRELFAASYEDWAGATPLFFPRILPSRSLRTSRDGRFDINLYKRHREYRALLGLAAVYALLLARMALIP